MRWFLRILVALIGALLLLGSVAVVYVQRSFPALDGQLRLAGLAAPVQVPGGVVLSHTWPREHLSHTRPVVLSVMVPSPLSVKAAQAGRARAHSRPASQGRGKKRFMQHLEKRKTKRKRKRKAVHPPRPQAAGGARPATGHGV